MGRSQGALTSLEGPPPGLVLTEAQLAALEKAKTEKEAHGEYDSEYPGYCGARDMFYVGNLKGVGRVYQQTFIDTYAVARPLPSQAPGGQSLSAAIVPRPQACAG